MNAKYSKSNKLNTVLNQSMALSELLSSFCNAPLMYCYMTSNASFLKKDNLILGSFVVVIGCTHTHTHLFKLNNSSTVEKRFSFSSSYSSSSSFSTSRHLLLLFSFTFLFFFLARRYVHVLLFLFSSSSSIQFPFHPPYRTSSSRHDFVHF